MAERAQQPEHQSESGEERKWLLSRGRLLIVWAALLWSSSGYFAKHEIFQSWPPESRGPLLTFWRALFAGLLILPLVRRPTWHRRLIPMTLTFAAMNVTYLTAMVYTTAANAIWLQSTGPVWVFLIGLVTLREPVRRIDLALLLFGALGVGTILTYELQQPGQPIGVWCGLISGMLYGSIVLFLRGLRTQDSAWMISLNLLVTAAITSPMMLQTGIWPTPRQLFVLAAFGFLQMGLPYVLFSYAMRTVRSHEASGIALLEPLLVPVWAFLVWHEVAKPWTIVGGAFILTGLAIRYVVPMKRDKLLHVSRFHSFFRR